MERKKNYKRGRRFVREKEDVEERKRNYKRKKIHRKGGLFTGEEEE